MEAEICYNEYWRESEVFKLEEEKERQTEREEIQKVKDGWENDKKT